VRLLFSRLCRRPGVQDVTFVGRLATYRYYNMDQVAQALSTYGRIAKEQGRASALSQTEPGIVLGAGAT
jgi:hypothetical protein